MATAISAGEYALLSRSFDKGFREAVFVFMFTWAMEYGRYGGLYAGRWTTRLGGCRTGCPFGRVRSLIQGAY